MANRIQRPVVPAMFFFEAQLAANEVIVIPVYRAVSGRSDSSIAVMAAAGTKFSFTIEHPSAVAAQMQAYPHQGKLRAYLSSVQGDYPAVANPDGFARVWNADATITADSIYTHAEHATALRITAPAGGGFVVLYGDY